MIKKMDEAVPTGVTVTETVLAKIQPTSIAAMVVSSNRIGSFPLQYISPKIARPPWYLIWRLDIWYYKYRRWRRGDKTFYETFGDPNAS